MKRLFIPAAFAAILLLVACLPTVATPTPVDVSAIVTSAVGTAFTELTMAAPTTTAIPTLTPTLTPTDTPVPTSMPDYSGIKFVSLYLINVSQTVFVFQLNGSRGEFRGTGNDLLQFECNVSAEEPNKLSCYGPYQAPGQEILFKLFPADRTDPVLTVDMIAPDAYPPTPVGMTCDSEPLWLRFPGQYDYGCYAVSCYINSTYYGGSADTCTNPWMWPVP
jgi:hypothetical protein